MARMPPFAHCVTSQGLSCGLRNDGTVVCSTGSQRVELGGAYDRLWVHGENACFASIINGNVTCYSSGAIVPLSVYAPPPADATFLTVKSAVATVSTGNNGTMCGI